VDGAVVGKKDCVSYVENLEKIWLIRAMEGGKEKASNEPIVVSYS
jgi:hypothetical protein